MEVTFTEIYSSLFKEAAESTKQLNYTDIHLFNRWQKDDSLRVVVPEQSPEIALSGRGRVLSNNELPQTSRNNGYSS